MMGLEKLLRGLYGSVPQLDMDRQFARSRVIQPMTFDFRALADGIRRNNVGTAGIEFEALAEIRDGKVMIQPTGQTFPLSGDPPAEKGAVWRRMKVQGWEDLAITRVEILR
ncbi:MAG: hypothetical protein HY293_09530 [Planctomycetes bacterium]|nr:hypothetical protein [Planctomycetota bacterium]